MTAKQASLVNTLRLSGPSICMEAAAEIERQAKEIEALYKTQDALARGYYPGRDK